MKFFLLFLTIFFFATTYAQTVIKTDNGMIVITGNDTLFFSSEAIASGKQLYSENRNDLAKKTKVIPVIRPYSSDLYSEKLMEVRASDEYKAAYKNQLAEELAKRDVHELLFLAYPPQQQVSYLITQPQYREPRKK